MKIALVVYGSLDQLSGGYLYDRQVLASLRWRGVQTDVHSLPAAPYLLCLLHNLRPSLRRLLRRGRGEAARYDAVVVDELAHPSCFLALGAAGQGRGRAAMRAPVFTLVHHLKCCEPLGPLRRGLARLMERRLLRRSDRLIVNSRATEASVRELLGAAPPLWVCPPGCDLHAPVGEGMARGPDAGGGLTILSTGNLIPRKGYDLLIEALAGLPELPWRLRLVGRPVDRRYAAGLRRLALRRGVGQRVRFPGQLSGRQLAEEYARADLFAFPSRFEGFGISLAEALRAGLPVVAFAGEAVAEVLGAAAAEVLGATGRTPSRAVGLVPAGDVPALREALRRLLSDPAARAAAAAASRERGARLPTWERTGQCFHRALQEGLDRA